jgi:transcriptional regulator with XRE-family HTH domain
MSSRQLALRAEVSPAQLNRIENDQVAQPRREILVAIARALNRNPVPLLILAGHVTGEDARRELRYLFRHEAELPEEWGAWVRFDLARVRALLADPNASAQDLGTIAADVFRVQETQETLWDDSYELASARGEGAAQLRRLMAVWPTIAAYRERVLEYAEHWAQIADLEYAASVRQLELEADANTAGDDQNGER